MTIEKTKRWSYVFFTFAGVLVILLMRVLSGSKVVGGLASVLILFLPIIISVSVGMALNAILADVREEMNYLIVRINELEKRINNK